MRRLAILALTLTLSITLAGCSSLDALGPSGSVEGTYSLVLINGSRLPYRFSTNVTLVSDDLTLYRDGTYEDYSRYASGSSRVEEGYYTSRNGSLVFEPYSGGSYQGAITGRVLTQIVSGYEQRFEKQ
ncbi:MAG: hypothetical protein ABIP93_06405 [Gemmatimonadaceae bacterium]